jgi:hypothetical protein
MNREQESHKLLFTAFVILTLASLTFMFSELSGDTGDVTGNVLRAERESTLPQGYDYQGALQRGKFTGQTDCSLCTSGALRPGMRNINSLCTGDYAVRLNLVGLHSSTALLDVNGEIFNMKAGQKYSLRDGMQLKLNSVSNKDGQESISYELGLLSYTTVLNEGDTRHMRICDKKVDLTVNSFEINPKTVHLTANGKDYVLAPAEARVLSNGVPLYIMHIDAKEDRWGAVGFEIG